MKKKYTCLVIILLIVLACLALGRIAGNNFINYDDNKYITENNFIQYGINKESVKWAFTTTYFSYWHPLTWISHMLDWSIFGANPSGHHIAGLLLHISAVVFLFLFLNKATGDIWSSAFATAFFAIHPLRVESVAWASDRKDVLSMFFAMTCFYTYAFYAKSPKLTRYLLCLILFSLALMSKPTMVTLPFVLMLLDYWPLKRWLAEGRNNLAGKLIWEKIPFICLSIAVCFITFWAQNKDEQLASIEYLSLFNRVGNSLVSYTLYLGKTFWPANLAVFYPFNLSLSLWKIFISGIFLTVITIFVFYYIRKMPFLFVGWLTYLGTLIPVIGFIQSGGQSMADRYTYLPSIGVTFILAWGIPSLLKTENIRKKILLPATIAIITVMAFLTWQQCGYWRDSLNLFSHALRVTQNNYLAHNSRGIAYGELSQYQKAIDDFNKAIGLKPDYFKAYNNRGFAYFKLGHNKNAIRDYNEAILLKPDYAKAYNNRGYIYLIQGNSIGGCKDAQKACALGVCETIKEAKLKGYCK
ncbi:MAG: tetratricopeptide repeat protein [Syntrophaceae bacterium]|nr:tetratricopeptide repeat protein [Syntrophaceae bacterium]